MQLDVYIPELQLAFEYHGEQHYKPIYSIQDFTHRQRQDEEKRNACNQVAIFLFIKLKKHSPIF